MFVFFLFLKADLIDKNSSLLQSISQLNVSQDFNSQFKLKYETTPISMRLLGEQTWPLDILLSSFFRSDPMVKKQKERNE